MFRIRAADEGDRGFVVATLAKSFYDSPTVRGMDRADYAAVMKHQAETILDEHDVWVACAEDEPSVLLGWCAFDARDPGMLLYVYVRRDFRGNGIAKALVGQQCIMHYGARTRGIEMGRLPAAWRYRPDRWWK